uniref:UbiA prenyltransferase family protein n=1 Tax=viral metagenome TaxID=1070528 RepID=A0A6C0DCD2_9ZZZZ
MYFKSILIGFFIIISRTSGFVSIKTMQKSTNLQTYINPWNDLSGITQYNHFVQIRSTIQKKTSGLVKIIRTENILPTFLLSISSGFIMKPKLSVLIKSMPFIVAVVITMLIMSNSMIINDIFDMEIDKINTPTRPLITGELTKQEAIGISIGLTLISELLSLRYLNASSQPIVHIANIVIILYTPIFKRILFIKNLTCAGLISISTIFPALCIENINGNFGLLMVLARMILFGSMSVEMLYDIKDTDGDLQNGINTIPIKYGKPFTYRLICKILTFSILTNMIVLSSLYNYIYGIIFFILQSPMLTRLNDVKNTVFGKKTIKKYGLKTTETLATTLIFLCFLARQYQA